MRYREFPVGGSTLVLPHSPSIVPGVRGESLWLPNTQFTRKPLRFSATAHRAVGRRRKRDTLPGASFSWVSTTPAATAIPIASGSIVSYGSGIEFARQRIAAELRRRQRRQLDGL